MRTAARAIGLCWSAGDWDPARSVPFDSLRMRAIPEVELVSLQRRPAADPALRYRANGTSGHRHAADRAPIAGLDVVVTVDTMVAHSRARSEPGCLLLRRHADWRWMPDRAELALVSLDAAVPPSEEGHWSAPLERLAADLRRLGAVHPMTRTSCSS